MATYLNPYTVSWIRRNDQGSTVRFEDSNRVTTRSNRRYILVFRPAASAPGRVILRTDSYETGIRRRDAEMATRTDGRFILVDTVSGLISGGRPVVYSVEVTSTDYSF